MALVLLFFKSISYPRFGLGNKYLLPATTPTNRLANFEIYGVVDLENNNEPHVAGIYKDTVSIMITW